MESPERATSPALILNKTNSRMMSQLQMVNGYISPNFFQNQSIEH